MSFTRHNFHYLNHLIAQSLTLTTSLLPLLYKHIQLGRNLKGIHAAKNSKKHIAFLNTSPLLSSITYNPFILFFIRI